MACESKLEPAAQVLPTRRAADTPEPECTKPALGRVASAPTGIPNVAFLGDSITAGMGLSEQEAYPAVLAERFRAQGRPFQLANAGVSGDTSAGGLRRIDWVLRQRPSVVVVELGANDALRGRPAREIEQNLHAILRKIILHDACPLLLGMRVPPSMGQEYAEEFAALYERVAQQENVPLVPFFMQGVAGVPELNLDDGLHPTAEGHKKLAENVALPLERALSGCPRGKQGP